MPTLLKIDASPRDLDRSISRALGDQFAREWQGAHGGEVLERDLAKTHIPFIDTQFIAGLFTPPDQQTEEHRKTLRASDEFIEELRRADHILITSPIYNFAIPAALKAWIDHVVRGGKTFSVSADGQYSGLLSNKRATVILASSGAYAGTPGESMDFATPYLRMILGFMGITNVEFVRAGGARDVSVGKVSRSDFLAPFQSAVRTAATAA